jgi:hypothetical protein
MLVVCNRRNRVGACRSIADEMVAAMVGGLETALTTFDERCRPAYFALNNQRCSGCRRLCPSFGRCDQRAMRHFANGSRPSRESEGVDLRQHRVAVSPRPLGVAVTECRRSAGSVGQASGVTVRPRGAGVGRRRDA